MTDLPLLFEQLVRFQIELWNGVDSRLRRQADVSLGSLESMRAIDARGTCRVNDIADDLIITVGGASKLIDRLEQSGRCARRANPDDRRSSLIELTQQGRDDLARANQAFAEELDVWFGAIPDETRAVLLHSLTQLRTAAPQLTAR